MTATYRTQDGVTLFATTPEDLVRELHKLSLSPCPTDAEFMRQTTARVSLQTGLRIAAHPAAAFIRGLVAAGLLIED